MEYNRVSEPVSGDAGTWAMLCHLAALVGFLGNGVGFIVGPLIVWLIKRGEDPFIDEQGKEALNFQITMFIAFLIAGLLVLIVIGVVLLPILGLLEIVLPIIAGIKANNGEHYRYPFAVRLIQ